MPFETYDDTRRYANLIHNITAEKSMPPTFAIPEAGRVSNDPTLTPDQISLFAAWANAQAPAGDPHDAPKIADRSSGWTIGKPDLIVKMSQPVEVPASGNVEYTYEIVPTHFKKARWIQAAEVLPSLPANVRHTVIFIRPPGSKWLRHAPVGKPFTATDLSSAQDRRSGETNSEILLVYAPGTSPEELPSTMAKLIPAGSDLVFRMQYATNGNEGADQTSVGLVFSKHPPAQRVLTLQLTNDHFVVPPNAPDYRVEATGTINKDAVLLSCFPLMHLRGKRFEYNILNGDQRSGTLSEPKFETLLRVNYDLRWQMNYPFVERQLLKAGTELQAVAWYDNSPNNPYNPDPTASVRWGEKASDEMMAGFFDVAVPANTNKGNYFIQH
jgi:hypothetical protein